MKLLSVLFLFISCSASAGNFSNLDNPKTKYWDRGACEATEQVACYDVTSCPADQCSLKPVDDTSRPKYVKAQESSCSGQDDCKAKLQDLVCDSGSALINADYSSIYCAVQSGFEKMQGLVKDDVKAAAVKQAADAAAARQALISEGLRRQDVGRRIIALIAANNQSKGMSNDDAVALNQTLAPIVAQLQTGSIPSAKALVQRLQPSGVITQTDIDLTLGQFTAEGF